jgi:hypothetical protein
MSASTHWERAVNNILFNLHIFTIALATGIVASTAKTATDAYLNTNSAVHERDHVAILVHDWSSSLLPVLRQLRIAAASPNPPPALRRPIVILTARPKAAAQALVEPAAAAAAAGVRRLQVALRKRVVGW